MVARGNHIHRGTRARRSAREHVATEPTPARPVRTKAACVYSLRDEATGATSGKPAPGLPGLLEPLPSGVHGRGLSDLRTGDASAGRDAAAGQLRADRGIAHHVAARGGRLDVNSGWSPRHRARAVDRTPRAPPTLGRRSGAGASAGRGRRRWHSVSPAARPERADDQLHRIRPQIREHAHHPLLE